MFTNRIRQHLPASGHGAPSNSRELPQGFVKLPAAIADGMPHAALRQLYQQAYQDAQQQVRDKLLNLLRSRAGFANQPWTLN